MSSRDGVTNATPTRDSDQCSPTTAFAHPSERHIPLTGLTVGIITIVTIGAVNHHLANLGLPPPSAFGSPPDDLDPTRDEIVPGYIEGHTTHRPCYLCTRHRPR